MLTGKENSTLVNFDIDELNAYKCKSWWDIFGQGVVFQGIVTATRDYLKHKSLLALEEFGRYNAYFNNCQNFCTLFLQHIGLKRRNITSMKQVALVYAVAFVVATICDRRNKSIKAKH